MVKNLSTVDGQIFSPTLPSKVLSPNGLGELRREINFVSIVGFHQAKQLEISEFHKFDLGMNRKIYRTAARKSVSTTVKLQRKMQWLR